MVPAFRGKDEAALSVIGTHGRLPADFVAQHREPFVAELLVLGALCGSVGGFTGIEERYFVGSAGTNVRFLVFDVVVGPAFVAGEPAGCGKSVSRILSSVGSRQQRSERSERVLPFWEFVHCH